MVVQELEGNMVVIGILLTMWLGLIILDEVETRHRNKCVTQAMLKTLTRQRKDKDHART